jgi:hypothetical protein
MTAIPARLRSSTGAALLAAAIGSAAALLVAPSAAAQDAGNTETASLVPDGKATQTLRVFMTGYSYWDNAPARTPRIAKPVLHRIAGGTGTYEDPITLAVGHAIVDGVQILDVPAGTRFYIKRLKKYAIVEDVCGGGPSPQDGPCHTGRAGLPWFDIWVGGQKSTARKATACARRMTGFHTVVMNPDPGLPVKKGEITAGGC